MNWSSLLLLVLISACLLAPAQAAEPAAAAHTLVLVRHGHYQPVEGADPRSALGLSALGVAQASLAGARLAAWPKRIDGFVASPFRRARETAAVIAASLDAAAPIIDGNLAECTPPTRRAEIMREEKPEDLAACRDQLERAIAHYFRPGEAGERTDLLVCHGNVIRYLVTRALGVDSEAWLEMSVGHASVTVIRIEADGRRKVIAVGDVGHLPPNLLTGASGDPDRSLAAPTLD